MRTTLLNLGILISGAMHAQWTLVPSGTSTQLEAVHMIDAQSILSSGKDGVLVRSLNGGNTWSPLVSGYGDDINSIMQLSPLDFILFADGGVVIRSTDGGNTWLPGATATTSELVSAARVSGLIVAVGEGGAIVRSGSAGATWSSMPSGTQSDLQAVWALDANTWKVVGKDGTCLSSTDGGFNWNPLSVPASTDLNDITFLSSQIGLICGDEGLIMRSTDGGGVWSAVASGTGNELNALWSVSATEVYACGAGGTVLKTMDSGLTWMPMTTPTTAVLRDIVVSSGSGFAVGTLGTIIRLSPSTMGLNESDIALGVSLSPVPTNEEVTLTVIDARLKNALTAEVIDGKGAVVMGTGLIGDTARFAGLPTGSYVLRLNRDGVAVHTRRFVVAR